MYSSVLIINLTRAEWFGNTSTPLQDRSHDGEEEGILRHLCPVLCCS